MNFYDPTGRPKITVSRPAPQWAASTWGPYFDAMFPPQEVSTWISWKMTSTGTNIARRPWDQREELRAEYDDVHGTDRALWPAQHPGVVPDAVLSSAHGACLGCQWIDVTMPDFCADMATSWSSSSDVKHPSGRSHPWPAPPVGIGPACL
jgi:hypothetical protein